MGSAEPNMYDPATIRRIHILGVCGTGMGTFAGMLRERGFDVTGSDQNVYPPMSTLLEQWGVPVMAGSRAENLDPAPDLVIVGNVIRRENPEAVEMRRLGLPHTSFPEALARIFLADRRPTIVAGTHGKTTTTSLLAWLLDDGGCQPGFLVGGLPLNFRQSYQLGAPPLFVLEGDEYDTAYFEKTPKFIHYGPQDAVLTGVEFDHADIYPDLGAVTAAFDRFVALLPEDGCLTVCGHEARARAVAAGAACRVETYGFDPGHDWRVKPVAMDAAGTRFQLYREGRLFGTFVSPLFGRHNLLNAAAALACAARAGLTPETLAGSLLRFAGVRKRQEVKGVADGVTVIDDFAHHPTAVRETIRAVRQGYPGARLWAAYHPESNTSRRRVFQADYAEAFRQADVAIIAQALVKNDSLADDESIDVATIARDIEAMRVEAHGDLPVDDVLALLVAETAPGDVVLGMSGRDFEGLHDRLLTALEARAASRPTDDGDATRQAS